MNTNRTRLTLDSINSRLFPTTVLAADLVDRHAIIKLAFLLVPKVAEAIPLRRHLGIKGPDVVVDDARRLVDEVLVEELALEKAGFFALGVEGPVERDSVCVCVFVSRGNSSLYLSTYIYIDIFLGTWTL